MDAGDLRQITVVGIGAMGHGMAQVCATAGFNVVLLYRRPESLEAALAKIRNNLDLLVASRLLTPDDAEATLGRLSGIGTLAEAARDADLVLESLPEDLELKQRVYAELDALCPARTILASNTSSFRITDLAAVTRRPDRVCGVHWVAPPYVVPVIEVIAGRHTAPETIAIAKDFVRRVGKVPVVAKDVPGFVLVRLANALYNEAMALVEQGIASPQDVDNAYRLGSGLLGALLGPLRQADLAVNKHTTANVLAYLYRETGETKFKPPPILEEQIAAGRLGLAWGKGWHDYAGLDPEAIRRWRDKKLIAMLHFLKREGLLVEDPLPTGPP
jgi:3-hydroxybutyryl-CoA dehydrogenase